MTSSQETNIKDKVIDSWHIENTIKPVMHIEILTLKRIYM